MLISGRCRGHPRVTLGWSEDLVWVWDLCNRKNVEKVLGGGQTNGVKWYDGKVLSISGWERSWIQFSVGVAGQKGFQLWVPICWTALGFTLRAHHYWLCYWLADTIPPLPKDYGVAAEGWRVESTAHAYHCQVGEVEGLGFLWGKARLQDWGITAFIHVA